MDASSEVADLSLKNLELCEELTHIDGLARRLEMDKEAVLETADVELHRAKVSLEARLVRSGRSPGIFENVYFQAWKSPEKKLNHKSFVKVIKSLLFVRLIYAEFKSLMFLKERRSKYKPAGIRPFTLAAHIFRAASERTAPSLKRQKCFILLVKLLSHLSSFLVHGDQYNISISPFGPTTVTN